MAGEGESKDYNAFVKFFKVIGIFIISWLPKDFTEILLFSITIALIIIIASLIHYTTINSRIQKESRCYRDKQESNIGQGVYQVSAYTKDGTIIYAVTYNVAAKQYTIEQKCPDGTVQNKADIRVYDLGRKQTDRIEKIFECDKNYSLRDQTLYYKGDPGLVRFMEYGNTEFFERVAA